jgi:superfamily II DNA helicase RecQ
MMCDSSIPLRQRAYHHRCSKMAKEVMEEVFERTPYPWQQKVIAHLCCMPLPDSGIYPVPVLLVRLTGGGKSAVRDVYSVLNGGFLLTITPLLSLGADQEEKISKKAKQGTGTVVSVHLDEIRLLADQQALVNRLKLLPLDDLVITHVILI